MMNHYYSLLTIVAIALIAGVSDALSPQKIISGTKAALGEFPYQVSLRRSGKHICGGSIISSRLVLTARHCIDYRTPPPYTNVLVMTGSIEVTGGQNHTVKSVHFYDPDQLELEQDGNDFIDPSDLEPHDIAIVELNEDIPFNNYQKAVRVSSIPFVIGKTAIVTGWGYLRANLQKHSHYLQKLSVRISGPFYANPRFIAARGNFPSGVCHGDSGSPLVRNGYVIGIVSRGSCARDYFSDVYVNVARHYAWIQQHMMRVESKHPRVDSKIQQSMQ